MTTKVLRLAAIAGLLSTLASRAYAAEPIVGRYLAEDGAAVIEIAPCGPALCGKVVKILNARADSKAILGTLILSGLIDDGAIWTGMVRNPASGKAYKAKVRRNADHTVKVEGCVSFVCKGPIWTPTT